MEFMSVDAQATQHVKYSDLEVKVMRRIRCTARRIALIMMLCASVLAGLGAFATQPRIDLTGVWSCDDRGTYYIRQIGDTVYWYGESSSVSPQWSNVAYGKLSGNILVLMWADVPKGANMVHGILVLRVEQNTMSVIQKTGGYGGNYWRRR